jgi:voltage-gated potassium channel
MKGLFQSKLQKAFLLLVVVVAIGVLGYKFISGYSFVDALYMTVITISTVGFGEVNPLNDQEKLFTIFLITISIVSFGYTVSAFTEYIISGQLFQQLKLKKVQKRIEQLEKHTIICGFGRNGKQAMVKLQNYKQEFVIVDMEEDVINKIEKKGDALYVHGDATTDEILKKAGIHNASNLITALPSDADNLFVVLTARQLNSDCKIISRASNETSYDKLKIAGADNVIMPDKLGGDHMASLVVTPDVLEFVGRLTVEGEKTANLEEVSVNLLPKEYLQKTILDLDLRKKTGCTVIGLKSPDGNYIINPEASLPLEKDSNLIVLGRPEQITKLRELF